MSENALQQKLSALLKDRERLQVEMMAIIRRELAHPEASDRAAGAVDIWNTLQAELDKVEKLIAIAPQQIESNDMIETNAIMRHWAVR